MTQLIKTELEQLNASYMNKYTTTKHVVDRASNKYIE